MFVSSLHRRPGSETDFWALDAHSLEYATKRTSGLAPLETVKAFSNIDITDANARAGFDLFRDRAMLEIVVP